MPIYTPDGCELPKKSNAGTNATNAIFATTAAPAHAAGNRCIAGASTLPLLRLSNHRTSPDDSRGLLLCLPAQRGDHHLVQFRRQPLVFLRFAGVPARRRLVRALRQ
jgi:hypothetical protein